LINLVFNAVDALPAGGTITFVTRSLEVEKNGSGERQIQIEVKDNGTGMDEKTRQHCLEPFFSTKSLRGGTGLGLAMVYGMMQRSDGAIAVESAPGKGTCMRLSFPLRQKSAAAVCDTKPQAPSSRTLRVLCVDDEELVRQLLLDCLTQFNHKVTAVPDGEEALKSLRSAKQDRKPFEVVITDLGMPKMDGHQLARAIRAENPKLPIIMMTGWGAMMKDEGDRAPDVDALVGKPPQLHELNSLLLQLVPLEQSTA
jgi:CheY-like chemotaxis protein